MANYNYVIDSHYKPYSLQELLVPYMLYKDAFEKTQQMSWDLKDKSDTFKYLSETLPEDSRARQIYENYANDLMDKSAALDRHGLTMTLRSGLSDMRRRYAGEIGRLEKAQTTLDKIKELRFQMGAKDPTMIYATNNLSIDSFLDGTMPNMYGISGQDLYQKGMIAGAAHAKSQNSAADIGTVIQGLYNDFVTSTGYNPNDLYAFRENISHIPELAQAVDSILIANGVYDNIKDPNGLNKARTNVINGMIDGALGSTEVKHSPVRNGNPDWKDQQQVALGWAKQKLDEMEFQLKVSALQDSQSKQAQDNSARINPRALRSQAELGQEAKDMEKYKKYFDVMPDGSWRLNKNGIAALEEEVPEYSSLRSGVSGAVVGVKHSDFYNFMKKITGKDPITNPTTQLKDLSPTEAFKTYDKFFSDSGDAFKKYYENQGNNYDMYHSTEWVRQLDSSYAKDLKTQVLGSSSIYSAEFSGKEGFKRNIIDKDELKDYAPVDISYSKYGTTINWVNEDGETIRTMAPKSINESALRDIQNAERAASEYKSILDKGKVPKINPKTGYIDRWKDGSIVFGEENLSDEQRAAFYNSYINSLNDLYNIGDRYYYPTQTKTLNSEPQIPQGLW